jgi:hypothetical protein
MPTDALDQTPSTAADVANRFASLTIYEPSQEFLDAPDVERPVTVKGDSAIYESEPMTSFEDAIFALTALVNNMNQVKSHIQWIWSNYKDGIFDLAAAAITTNTAISLVRNMMEDISPLLKLHGGFGSMLERFHVLQCLVKGWKLSDITVPRKDNFNPETYDTASGTYFMAYRLLEGFVDVLQPGQLPLYREGMFGHYDPESDRSRKTGQQKFEDDRALLMPFFTELMTVVRCFSDWPAKDEFIRGMQELDKSGELPFYVVFAAQVFLDITYELGPHIQRAFEYLVQNTTFMDNDISIHLEFHKKLKIAHWPASNDQVVRELQRNIQWIGKDPLRPVQVRMLQRMGADVPNTESHRLLRMSPLISGLLLYHFRARYLDLGLAVADAWGSIQYCKHLYNALRQQNLIAHTWADMDVLYAILGPESFFVGCEEPKTPEECFKKFSSESQPYSFSTILVDLLASRSKLPERSLLRGTCWEPVALLIKQIENTNS